MKFKVSLVKKGYFTEAQPHFKKAGFNEVVTKTDYGLRYTYDSFEAEFRTAEDFDALDSTCNKHGLIICFNDKEIQVYNGYNE